MHTILSKCVIIQTSIFVLTSETGTEANQNQTADMYPWDRAWSHGGVSGGQQVQAVSYLHSTRPWPPQRSSPPCSSCPPTLPAAPDGFAKPTPTQRLWQRLEVTELPLLPSTSCRSSVRSQSSTGSDLRRLSTTMPGRPWPSTGSPRRGSWAAQCWVLTSLLASCRRSGWRYDRQGW